jgi:hypothetical protein
MQFMTVQNAKQTTVINAAIEKRWMENWSSFACDVKAR